MVLELTRPIVQAPMAGGPSTPALAAAVSEAGGLGFLAAGYRTPEAVRDDVRAARELTGARVGVNIFLPGPPGDDEAVRRYAAELRAEADRWGVELGEPRADDDAWEAKVAVCVEERVPVVSFTFGLPRPDVVAALHDAGALVLVTVTTPEEAVAARDVGADALVVQGVEAGGHRGGFRDDDGVGEYGLLALLRLVARAADLPMVAAGGLVDGPSVAAALVAGAEAAQLGTAFLACPEAGTGPAHREALTGSTGTALTRAFSGRRARGLVNRFLAEHTAAPSAYPQVHHLTTPLRAAARTAGDAGGVNLWAGQAYRLVEPRPAGELVRRLTDDARAALARAAGC
ncbi:nitronate monooxygenase [Geodermatophilus dictyosporus]|uniref:Probable nitronate monooxygenase n=1 Tax=Geodermatophilus dictyosporus TaxID=1523247 RepID=A0A1I5UKM3_9ACTN|nr:nitronate monooxygenase [Geodermatophilus dictyosporus]SFP95790.1 nitronate monooxygenase [Geodermatophilus dictyosporus]